MKTYSFEDGKYEVDRDDNGLVIEVRRHGEPWPGGFNRVQFSKFFHAALNHIDQLEEKLLNAGQLTVEEVRQHLGEKLPGVLTTLSSVYGASTDEVMASLSAGSLARMELIERLLRQHSRPIDMVLHCPACWHQHIDAPEGPSQRVGDSPEVATGMAILDGAWTNPPHRSHLCDRCGHIWRPADVPTNGVAAVKTKGKNDSPLRPKP